MIKFNVSPHRLFGLLLLIVFTSALAACRSKGPAAPATVPAGEALAENSPAPAPARTPSLTPILPTNTLLAPDTETPSPSQTATQFVPKATIRIAVHGPLTGDLAKFGLGVMRAADLAVVQLAAPVAELGYAVELVPFDDQNDIGVGAANAEQIIADPVFLCGVGNVTSRVLIQVAEVYHKGSLPFISPSATASYLTDRGYLEINRLIGRNDDEGVAGARFAYEQGFVRVFIITQAEDLAHFIANHFKEESERLGLTVVGDAATDTEDDFGWLIDQVLASDADLVYFSSYSLSQAGRFFRDARAEGYQGTFLGISSMENPALLELAGPLLVDGGGMFFTNTIAPAAYYPDASKFQDDFLAEYGENPPVFSAEAYDAAGICLFAIEQASRNIGGELPTRAEVAEAIRAIQDYPGITGVYNFTTNGDPAPARYFVFRVVSSDPDDWDQNELVVTLELDPLDSDG